MVYFRSVLPESVLLQDNQVVSVDRNDNGDVAVWVLFGSVPNGGVANLRISFKGKVFLLKRQGVVFKVKVFGSFNRACVGNVPNVTTALAEYVCALRPIRLVVVNLRLDACLNELG